MVAVVFEISSILEFENRSRIYSTVSADAVSVCSFTSQGRILHLSNETKNLLSVWKFCLIGCSALGRHFSQSGNNDFEIQESANLVIFKLSHVGMV